MNFNKFRRGFSLTEIMIVVVVIAMLFTAMLPIMTKRRTGATTVDEPIWQFVSGSTQHDAYYDRNAPALTSIAYFGNSIEDIVPWYVSKVQIKANPKQHHIQFRYGDANGSLTGLFAMDNKGNTLGTSKLTGSSASDNSNDILSKADNGYNTVLGNGAFARIKIAKEATSIGANSSMGDSNSTTLGNDVTVVGSGANQYNNVSNGVSIGAGAGKAEKNNVSRTVALGASVLGVVDSKATQSVMAGADTATVGTFGAGNVILGSNYIGDSSDGTYANFNTILGNGAYENGSRWSNNMTVVGNMTCNTFHAGTNSDPWHPTNKTCIGYTSGSTEAGTSGLNWENDDLEHVFLGGMPRITLIGGRSILEVHNIPKSRLYTHNDDGVHPGGAKPDIAPTVVMNSNLVVRGNVYWSDTHGNLRSHTLNTPMYWRDKQLKGGIKEYIVPKTEYGTDRCDRKCWSRAGKKKWREGECNSLISDFLSMIGPVGDFLQGVATIVVGVTVMTWASLAVMFNTSVDVITIAGGLGSSALCTAFLVAADKTGLDTSQGEGGEITEQQTFEACVVNNDAWKNVTNPLSSYKWATSVIDSVMSRGDAGKRPVDQPSASVIEVQKTALTTCAMPHLYYPITFAGCPNLHIYKEVTPSDIRLKENISENRVAIEKLIFVMPYNYTYKADKTARKQVGVIAQDLQEYFPNSVKRGKDGYYNIRLDEMFFASINTTKNLDSIVQDLENGVSALEHDTKKLAEDNLSTQKRINEIERKVKKLEK